MERFLLLTYQKQTKKIELPEEANKAFRFAEVLNKYGISETNCFLQCYDKDVLEWIDLDDFIDIEIDNILNVRVIKQGNRLADDDEVPETTPSPLLQHM